MSKFYDTTDPLNAEAERAEQFAAGYRDHARHLIVQANEEENRARRLRERSRNIRHADKALRFGGRYGHSNPRTVCPDEHVSLDGPLWAAGESNCWECHKPLVERITYVASGVRFPGETETATLLCPEGDPVTFGDLGMGGSGWNLFTVELADDVPQPFGFQVTFTNQAGNKVAQSHVFATWREAHEYPRRDLAEGYTYRVDPIYRGVNYGVQAAAAARIDLSALFLNALNNPDWCFGCDLDNCSGCTSPTEALRRHHHRRPRLYGDTIIAKAVPTYGFDSPEDFDESLLPNQGCYWLRVGDVIAHVNADNPDPDEESLNAIRAVVTAAAAEFVKEPEVKSDFRVTLIEAELERVRAAIDTYEEIKGNDRSKPNYHRAKRWQSALHEREQRLQDELRKLLAA